MAATNIVEPCGVHRWTLRRFLRHPSLELAANIVGKIVGRCGNGRWRVVDQPLTHVRGQASLPFLGCALRGSVPAFVPVCGTFPHQIGGQPGDHFAEHSTRKTAISRAAFSAAAFGLPLFLLVERPGEHALSGFLTHFRRGWCHRPFLLFGPSLHGVQTVQNWRRNAAQNGRKKAQCHCVFLRSIASPVRAWEAPLRGDVCHHLAHFIVG